MILGSSSRIIKVMLESWNKHKDISSFLTINLALRLMYILYRTFDFMVNAIRSSADTHDLSVVKISHFLKKGTLKKSLNFNILWKQIACSPRKLVKEVVMCSCKTNQCFWWFNSLLNVNMTNGLKMRDICTRHHYRQTPSQPQKNIWKFCI